MPCYSPLKGWRDEETGALVFKGEGASSTAEVACGVCLGCRLDRSRMWAARIVHEASLHEYKHGNCFVTLTYRDKISATAEQLRNEQHIPDDWSLHLSHFQKFMKRLRKRYDDRTIRFFHSGEYGAICCHGIDLEHVACPFCNVGRPHYHACLFNIDFDDLVEYGHHLGEPRYTSPTLEELWGYGFVDVGRLNHDSAGYVARYCIKKVTGRQEADHYQRVVIPEGYVQELRPEYATMSRRPGLGRGWYEKFKTDCFPSDEMPVPGAGVFKGVPTYYARLYSEEDPLGWAEVQERRKEFHDGREGEYTSKRLEDKYKVKKAQIAHLKRGLT